MNLNEKKEMEEGRKEREFEAMLEKHGSSITKLCFFYSDNPAEVADMRQDALLNLWRGWDSFRGDSQMSTWVHRVVLNTCVSFTRRERRHRNRSDLSEIQAIADDGDDRSLLWKEMHARIRELNVRERAVILLWLEDFSYDDIASVMGLNRNTVATLIRRTKEKLTK